jgi:hypothetical protein
MLRKTTCWVAIFHFLLHPVRIVLGEDYEASPGTSIEMFDDAIAKIDHILIEELPKCNNLIDKAYHKNKQSYDSLRIKMHDTSISANNRAIYEQQLSKIENAIRAVTDKKIALSMMWNDLNKQREEILQNREFYLDMLDLKKLEEAQESVNNSLIKTNTHILKK